MWWFVKSDFTSPLRPSSRMTFSSKMSFSSRPSVGNIRKEKRAKKLEEIRKPLPSTPSAKRDRQDDGQWDTAETHTPGWAGYQTPGRAGPQTPSRRTPGQTLIGSFTIGISLDERRKQMDWMET